MEQQTATATETKVVIKRTIPNKQKSAIKLVMWTLSQVMEKDAMIAKIVEMFKVTETIETIIEMVDAVEKSPEYTMMDTELTAIRSPKTKKRAKVTGDPDAIIKQLVDMATTETTGGKKKAKVEGEEKKAPRGKKAAKPPSTDAPAATDAPTTDVETEPKKKAPRAKKAAKVDDSKVDDSKAPEAPTTETPTTDVVTEPKKKAPRAKKVDDSTKAITTEEAPKAPTDEAPEAPKTPPAAAEPEAATTEPNAKKAPAKKTKTTVESNGTTPNGTTPETESAKPKTKAPKAPKTKAPSNIVHPNEVVEVAEDLREDEYMLLNEVEVDGNTYMVDSSQNVYNEFNDVIGKYENGVVTMNA
jgi:hypothetical protein